MHFSAAPDRSVGTKKAIRFVHFGAKLFVLCLPLLFMSLGALARDGFETIRLAPGSSTEIEIPEGRSRRLKIQCDEGYREGGAKSQKRCSISVVRERFDLETRQCRYTDRGKEKCFRLVDPKGEVLGVYDNQGMADDILEGLEQQGLVCPRRAAPAGRRRR